MKIIAFSFAWIFFAFSPGKEYSVVNSKWRSEWAIETRADTAFLAKVKLTEVVALPPYCGIFKWEQAYKFELLDSANVAMYPGKYINIKFTCPREMGTTFFNSVESINFIFTGKKMLWASI